MKNNRVISIVTPSYNQGHFIEETITSVLDQQCPNLEYIIIDGGSTDNTIEIIKKYEKYLKYWVSEKDRGQAHAINKGLQHCTGDIFNWLNSDDYLEPESLLKIAEGFENNEVQMVAGKVRNFSETQEEIIPNQNLTAEGLMCWQPGVKFVQPGVWLRRALLQACGGIDEQYHYAFDWDLYIRYLYHFPAVKEMENLLVHFRLHENSKTVSLAESFSSEENKIIEKIYAMQQFAGLHKMCSYKIERESWTSFLKAESRSKSPILTKFLRVLRSMLAHKRTAFTRQTAGALKAFLLKKEIS